MLHATVHLSPPTPALSRDTELEVSPDVNLLGSISVSRPQVSKQVSRCDGIHQVRQSCWFWSNRLCLAQLWPLCVHTRRFEWTIHSKWEIQARFEVLKHFNYNIQMTSFWHGHALQSIMT